MLRADQSARRLRRRVDSRLRHRLLGRARRRARRSACASPGTSATSRWGRSPRCWASRSAPTIRTPRSATRGPRHHLRADPDLASRRADRPAPHAAERGVPERPELGPRRLHSDGLGDRRPADARPRLADADGMPGGRPRDLAARRPSTGMAKLAVRATGGYARVRQQFKTPIGTFEGIEEPLARMGGNLYMMDAARTLTASAVDLGEKPAVLSGIAKLHLTERARAGRQRRDGHRGRQGHLHGPVELPRRGVHADAGRDHRRGRQHPHAQPDRLRPGRDPLPSLRAEGDRRDAHRRRGDGRDRRSTRRCSATCASRCRTPRARW